MHTKAIEISIEHLRKQNTSELIGYNNDIIIGNNLGNINPLAHPIRLKAVTVLICQKGRIEGNINLKKFQITENQLFVNYPDNIIQINRVEDAAGYAIIISEKFLKQLKPNFRLNLDNLLNLHDNIPFNIPSEEFSYLESLYVLLSKHIKNENFEVIKSLILTLLHNIIALMTHYQNSVSLDSKSNTIRSRQLFDKFIKLLNDFHTKERSLYFYADKMCLSPKYVSTMIKSYSGRTALEWINGYVMLEARMMLHYTDMTIKEIAYNLNFPSQSAFGKYFRQQIGVSPKKYRKMEA